jgi:hypothetical protein
LTKFEWKLLANLGQGAYCCSCCHNKSINPSCMLLLLLLLLLLLCG